MADPAGRLVEGLPNRELQTAAAIDVADDGEAVAVRRPIRPLHVLEHVAGRTAARDAHARECATGLERTHGMAAAGTRHRAVARDAQDVRPRKTDRARLRAPGPADEDLDGPSLPRGSVQDRLAVRREAREGDRAPPERELMERRRLRLCQASFD